MRYLIGLMCLATICFGVFACSNESSANPQIAANQLLETPAAYQLTKTPTLLPQFTTFVASEPTPTAQENIK